MKRLFAAIVLGFVIFCGLDCERSFSPADYFPLKVGYTWSYSGLIHTITVSETAVFEREQQFTLSLYDSSAAILCKENYIRKGNRVYWTDFLPNIAGIPNIRFEPAVPISPISDRIGDVLTTSVLEKRDDGTACRVNVSCSIEDVGQFTIGLGTFGQCIKMHLRYEYAVGETRPFLAGSSYYWYAQDVGIVKFETPSGGGELLSAKFDDDRLFD